MNHQLPSLVHSGGAIVKHSEAPAAPAEKLAGQQYKAVKKVGSF